MFGKKTSEKVKVQILKRKEPIIRAQALENSLRKHYFLAPRRLKELDRLLRKWFSSLVCWFFPLLAVPSSPPCPYFKISSKDCVFQLTEYTFRVFTSYMSMRCIYQRDLAPEHQSRASRILYLQDGFSSKQCSVLSLMNCCCCPDSLWEHLAETLNHCNVSACPFLAPCIQVSDEHCRRQPLCSAYPKTVGFWLERVAMPHGNCSSSTPSPRNPSSKLQKNLHLS